MSGARTQQDLADRLGVSRVTVTKYFTRADWPVRKRGPWSDADVARARSFKQTLQDDRAEQGEPGAPEASQQIANLKRAKLAAETKLKVIQGRHEELKHQILSGRYIPRDLVDESLGGLASLFVQALDELEMQEPSIGPRLDHLRTRLAEQAQYELRRVEEVGLELAKRRRGRGRPGSKA